MDQGDKDRVWGSGQTLRQNSAALCPSGQGSISSLHGVGLKQQTHATAQWTARPWTLTSRPLSKPELRGDKWLSP